MSGRGQRGNNDACSVLTLLSVMSPSTHKQIRLFWYWYPGGWVCVCSRTLWVSSNELYCEAGSFSHHHNPHRFFQSEVWGFISPRWNPALWDLSCSPVVPPSLSACKCVTTWSASCHLAWSSSHCLAMGSLHPGCPSLPLLPVWMNVSSLTPWLSDFHTVWFIGSSGCFLFLNLLSFFWLC